MLSPKKQFQQQQEIVVVHHKSYSNIVFGLLQVRTQNFFYILQQGLDYIKFTINRNLIYFTIYIFIVTSTFVILESVKSIQNQRQYLIYQSTNERSSNVFPSKDLLQLTNGTQFCITHKTKQLKLSSSSDCYQSKYFVDDKKVPVQVSSLLKLAVLCVFLFCLFQHILNSIEIVVWGSNFFLGVHLFN
eukprot:TRINITY_DN4303_c2_g1_i1.p3 TRINITY_DN4303_c2_g1~~TRINITY_DN4303_c2_g1_i1.p3  ORF type:complete len:188 (+),score=-17.25 TRINITY_DN4303_c2_g1_i1:93-656(+)